MDNEERKRLSEETLNNIKKLVPNQQALMGDLMYRFQLREMEQYNKGWQGAEKHFKDVIIKGIVNDGVISTNVDVNHLERIVRIVEETK
jgi:hypothetical protein